MINLEEVAALVKKWAREIGDLQKEKLTKKNFKVKTKSTKTDLVTEIDLLSEKIIREKIKAKFTQHNILGEESHYTDNKSSYTWVIDPLDGTNNYANAYPIYAVSIALKKENKTLVGVIYLPELDEMYSAIRGKGAYKGDSKIYISQKSELETALIATGFPYDKNDSKINNLAPLNIILPQLRGIRRSGSAAFDLCSVASSQIDAFWEFKLKEWDYAAGLLIIKEAGGEVYQTEIEKSPLLIAGSKELVSKLRQKIEPIYINT